LKSVEKCQFGLKNCAKYRLIGGCKTGNNRWYDEIHIPIADKLFKEHLDELTKEERK